MSSDDKLRCGIKILHTGSSDPFLPHCIAHDTGYMEGGAVGRMVEVDKAFYKAMFKDALRKPWLLPRAFLYTAFVMAGGRWVWNHDPEGAWRDDKPSVALLTRALASNVAPKFFGVPGPQEPTVFH